jgi:L-serine/L-threonine ammonia-lyase
MTNILHNKTPVLYSHALSAKLCKKIYFKMDCHQPSGSFKIRGVGKRCQEAAKEGSNHFVIASGGNAGLATAYAGWKLGVKTTVVVPSTTSLAMCNKISHLDAQVKVFGDVWDDTNIYAQSLVKKENATYIHPFDHPSIWQGNASVIDECVLQIDQPDTVLVSVGGGGYFCGIMEGLERNSWNKTKVITAETHGAASLKKAIEAKELITLDKIESIASSLGAKRVAQRAFDWALEKEVRAYSVSDNEAIAACQAFLEETGSLVEPACGAALAAVYQNLDVIQDSDSVLVMVCGGSGLSLDKLISYL